MARFDVHRLRSGDGFVLDCQADLLSHLQSRFVVPLMPPEQGPQRAARLNPLFNVHGTKLAMYTQYAGAMQRNELGPVVALLSDHDMEILAAIDMLNMGY
jgi:toxin CcdB